MELSLKCGLKTNDSQNKQGKSSRKRSTNCIPEINSHYLEKGFKEQLLDCFNAKKQLNTDNGCSLINYPFTICTLANFVTPETFIDQLKEELVDQIFYEKNNDLYKFQQTDDLRTISTPYVKEIWKFLCKNVHKWLCEVTGLELNETVDSTCSRYDYTDTLLCHDDELDTRRIAFVLYLVPPWKTTDGGCLNLFNMDEHLQPKNIVETICPANNQLVWFEVTEGSHHQVSEVLCQNKSRLSINGWFHTRPLPRQPRYVEPRVPLHTWSQIEEESFYDWINPIYLDPEVQSQVQEKFENDSEIELQEFIQDEKYQALVVAIKNTEIIWQDKGPPNKRKYKCVKFANPENNDMDSADSSMPVILKDFQKFLQSEMMFLTLSNLTGLSLHPMACNDDSVNSDVSESDSENAVTCDGDSIENNETVKTTGAIPEKSEEITPDENKIKKSEQNLEVACGSKKEGVSGVSSKEKSKPSKKRRKLDQKVDETNNQSANNTTDIKECNPKCCGELRKWQQNDYTLLHDTDIEGMEFALDAMFYCLCKGWEESFGGYTSYITKGEDEELLTVVPSENSLALVYRDKETLRFVKHINNTVQHTNNIESPEFYDFSLVYYE